MSKLLAKLFSMTLLIGAALCGPVLAETEVKIALIEPLSGPWAGSGEMSRRGAALAVDDINRAGGVKALGGAKISLVVMDAGDTPETAKNAAQLLISRNRDLAAGIGANISTLTLAVTEVTERAGLPWLTLSFSPAVTSRGFHYVFQTSLPADKQADLALPTVLRIARDAGAKPTKLAIIMDNTASPVGFTKNMRDPGALDQYGLKLAVDETFAPPLSDAAPVMQKLRAARPDFVFLLPTVISDIKLTLEKATELRLGRDRLQMIENGGPPGSPDLLSVLGKEQLEGLMFITVNWPGKQDEELVKRFKQVTGQPWMPMDSIVNYAHVWIIKEAIERAASADPQKVSEALHAMDLSDGPARLFPEGRIKFDAQGRREGASIVIVQWHNGEPVLVYPSEIATAKPNWVQP